MRPTPTHKTIGEYIDKSPKIIEQLVTSKLNNKYQDLLYNDNTKLYPFMFYIIFVLLKHKVFESICGTSSRTIALTLLDNTGVGNALSGSVFLARMFLSPYYYYVEISSM